MGRSSSPIDIHHSHNHHTSDTMTRSTSPLHFLNPAAVAHLTHCHHHHHHSSPSRASSSAAAAQADISRLLDPAYLPSSSSRGAHGAPSTAAPAYVYVDPHGDMHDPDYRHFPVSQHHHTNLNSSPKRRGTSPRRPHFDWEMEIDEQALEEEYYEEEGSFAKHSAGPHYHPTQYTHNHNYNYTAPRFPATASSSRTWSSSGQSGQSSSATRPRDSSFSTTVSVPMSKYSPTYSPTYYSPTGTASTLPTSYEDDAELSVESPFDEKEKEKTEKQEKEKERKKLRRLSRGDKEKEKERLRAAEKEREKEKEREEEAKREKEAEEQREREREERRASLEYNNYIDLTPSPRRTSRTYGRSRHRRSLDLYAADDEERRSALYPSEYPEDEEEDDSTRLHTGLTSLHPPSLKLGGNGAGNEYVPTCTQSLRRQWQALSLSFRFSLFRAQRRVMRRVASLTT